MTLLDFVILLLIAGVCGSIGQALAGYSLGGCLVSVAVGFVGALLGMWLAQSLGLPLFFAISVGGRDFPIVWSIIGSGLLAAVVGLLTRRRMLLR